RPESDDLLELLNKKLAEIYFTPGKAIRDLVFNAAGEASSQKAVESLVTELRLEVQLLHEELRARVGTVRTHLGLINRFKARCEWYDRDRLRALARGSKKKVENVLTLELAKFLFDVGLNPLTRPIAGCLEPDLLSPGAAGWTLYVEAKQYSS